MLRAAAHMNRIQQLGNMQFPEHIGVSDNQLLFGVLESVFYSLFRVMAPRWQGVLGAESFRSLCVEAPCFFGFLKMVKNGTPLKRIAHF